MDGYRVEIEFAYLNFMGERDIHRKETYHYGEYLSDLYRNMKSGIADFTRNGFWVDGSECDDEFVTPSAILGAKIRITEC